MNIPRSLSLLILVITILLLSSSTALAQEKLNHQRRVVIINQVRGEECCQPGSIKFLSNQISQSERLDLPMAFAIRYDALNNQDYVNLFQNLPPGQIELVGFLEITPTLAADSQVEYKGDLEKWYEAHQAYTIGYSKDDRIKIVDQYLDQFRKVFGKLPTVITSWIIDTPTANYLKNKHGIKVVQITREQWGTDSYTLSGGPVHYPYIASSNWLFQPSNSEEGLLVIRQTGSDPLRNYGDTTSSFTTQPNDYSIDGKSINYFTFLADQLLNQTQNPYSFLLLGLENSMDERYQDEYVKQLEWLAEYKNNKDGLKVVLPTNFYQEYINQGWSSKSIWFTSGGDWSRANNDQAVWINSSRYRARLLNKNDEILITDLRIYCDTCDDPYSYQVAENRGFWVTPFIVNGSRLYKENYTELSFWQKLKLSLQLKILPEMQQENKEPNSSANDLSTFPQSIKLTETGSELKILNNKIELKNKLDQPYTITFKPGEIEFVGQNVEKELKIQLENLTSFNTALNFSNNVVTWNNQGFYLKLDCESPTICALIPGATNEFATKKLIVDEHAQYFPEIINKPISEDKTVAYAHNKYAVLGESPARIVVIPRDMYGYSTQLSSEIEVYSNTNEDPKIQYQDGNSGTIFVDLDNNQPGIYSVSLRMPASDRVIEKNVDVVFTKDCSNEVLACIKSPKQIGWYIKAKAYQFLRS